MIPANQAVDIYYLGGALMRTSPYVWRRLLVRSCCSLSELHQTILCSFGWSAESSSSVSDAQSILFRRQCCDQSAAVGVSICGWRAAFSMTCISVRTGADAGLAAPDPAGEDRHGRAVGLLSPGQRNNCPVCERRMPTASLSRMPPACCKWQNCSRSDVRIAKRC